MIYLADMKADDNVDTIVWSMIELTCIIVCGSLPPLRPWFGKLIPSIETLKSVTWKNSRSKSRANASSSKTGDFTDRSRPNTYPDKNSATSTSDEYPLKPMDHKAMWDEP